MPLIPRVTDSVNMTPSSPVPIRGSSVAGMADAAMAGVGGDITKLGVALVQHMQKQEDMKQDNAYQLSASQLESTYSTAYDEAKRQAAPDGSDLMDKFNDIVADPSEQIKAQGPTSSAYADKLNTADTIMRTRIGARAKIEGASMLEKYNADSAVKIGDTFADSVRENPNTDMMENRVKAYGSYIDDKITKGIFSPDSREKLMNSFNEKLGLSYVEGLANQGSYGQAVNALRSNQADTSMVSNMDPDDAKSLGLIDSTQAHALKDQGKTYDVPVLTGKDGQKMTPSMAAAMGAIDPLKKNALIDQMKGKAEAASSLRLSELNSNVNALESLAYNGGDISQAQIVDVKNQINLNSSLTPFARVRLMDAVNTAAVANSTIQNLQNTPRSKWAGIVNSFDYKVGLAHDQAAAADPQMANASADLTVQANRLQAKNMMQTYMGKLAKNQSDDAGQFSIESDKMLTNLYSGTKDNDPGASQKFARQTMARQQYLQIPSEDQSILPNQDARALGATLKNMPNTESANDFLNQLQHKWGPYYPQVFQEISATDKQIAKYSAATYAPASTRFELIDAIKNQDAIKSAFDNMPSKKVSSEAIESAVQTKLRPFSQAVSGSANDSSRLAITNNFRDAMALQVKRDFVRGQTDINAATDRAFNDLVGSQFHVIQSGNSAIVAPRVFQGQPILPEQISSYMAAKSSPQGLKELGLEVPNDPTGKYARDPESFYRDLQVTGKWVSNQGQDGIRLMNVNMDGSLSPIFDKYGKPVEKKFNQILKEPASFGYQKQLKKFAPGAPGGG